MGVDRKLRNGDWAGIDTHGPKGVDFEEKRLWSLLDMIARYGAFLYRVSRMMSEMSHALTMGDEAVAEFVKELNIDKDEDLRDLKRKTFFELFDEFGLKLSRLSIDRYLLNINHVRDKSHMKAFIEELDGRLRDELKSVWFMHLSDDAANQYNNPRKGWESILARAIMLRLTPSMFCPMVRLYRRGESGEGKTVCGNGYGESFEIISRANWPIWSWGIPMRRLGR